MFLRCLNRTDFRNDIGTDQERLSSPSVSLEFRAEQPINEDGNLLAPHASIRASPGEVKIIHFQNDCQALLHLHPD